MWSHTNPYDLGSEKILNCRISGEAVAQEPVITDAIYVLHESAIS